MNAHQVRGITGLLDGILSSVPPAGRDRRKTKQSQRTTATAERPPPSSPVSPIAVRRGRPPGTGGRVCPKEKVTVWINSSLIRSYRDWTWQARCQVSHLVERALADYHERNRQQPATK